LLNLSTVADAQISNPPWVKFQSAGWVNFPSAPTWLHFVDGVALTRWDFVGAAIALVGMAVIALQPATGA